MKDIKNYLHLYLGCYCTMIDGDAQQRRFTLNAYNLNYYRQWSSNLKPILRPLSSMTEDEALHIAWFNLDSEKHLDKDSRITKDEISANVVYNDGGLLVDENAAVVIDLTCRCFEGQVCIRTNGDIELWNDAGEKLPIERPAENVIFLLSKNFDLFGLIESGLAIDKTSLRP